MFDIDRALAETVQSGSSDLHIKVAAAPTVRRRGGLEALPGYEPLTAADTEGALRHIARETAMVEFEEVGEADFSYAIPNVARFRVNAFRQRGSVSLALRVIPFQVRTIEELETAGGDDIKVMGLKREKLRIKDRITWLSAKITPDIIA